MAADSFLFRYTTTAEQGVSLRAEQQGDLILITPLTNAARYWIEKKIPSGATRTDGVLVVAPRYFSQLADQIIAAGFTFERDALLN